MKQNAGWHVENGEIKSTCEATLVCPVCRSAMVMLKRTISAIGTLVKGATGAVSVNPACFMCLPQTDMKRNTQTLVDLNPEPGLKCCGRTQTGARAERSHLADLNLHMSDCREEVLSISRGDNSSH